MRALTLFTALLSFTTFTNMAQADYFYWQDPKTGASLTFPDTWRTINNQKPDDLVTVIGPSEKDRPICRLRARGDNRFTIYPVWYSGDVQNVAYAQNFWNAYVGEYDNVTARLYNDDAGLSRAWASMAVIDYSDTTPKSEPLVMRTAQMWAGVYHDTSFVLECSANAQGFNLWQPDFISIAKSVELRKVIHENVNGYYPYIPLGIDMTHPVMNGDEQMGRTFN